MRHTLAIAQAAALCLCLHVSAALALQVDEARFDVILRGIPAGQLVFRGELEGDRYAVAGKVQSTGLVGRLLTFRYDATARGSVKGESFTPSFYTQETDRRGRQASAQMRYQSGVPQPPEIVPPRPPAHYDLEPSTQGGTLDPLTAIYAVLRDQTPEDACDVQLILFDGRRQTQVTLGRPSQTQDGEFTCTGEYRRLAGFSPEDMAERSVFPMQLRLAPEGDMLRVIEVRVPTVYGDAVLRRR